MVNRHRRSCDRSPWRHPLAARPEDAHAGEQPLLFRILVDTEAERIGKKRSGNSALGEP
jgi:hypothetical protein